MARLDGKVTFITGAGAGIARQACIRFAAEGASIGVAEINPETGADTASVVQANGGRAIAITTDVTQPDQVERAIQETVAAFGKLDIIYNCAGGSAPPDDSVTNMPIEAWDRSIQIDLYGTFLGCRFGIPELRKAGGGSIVNMSSAMGLLGETQGFPPRHSYSAAKGAVSALTRCVAAEYAKDKIRCNALAPCFIETERNVAVKAGFSNVQLDALDANHPLGVGQSEDIVNAALFLASDESKLISGTVIPVDGGMTIT
jgi:NAD(P)-dependent dehydrogenase (short-subunit alcohol dehydrogenase family)